MTEVATFGSLFSGIGGIDLGLERAGWRAIWQSEIDPYASRVLAKHWPDVPNLGDVTTIDWSSVDRPDLICGGYPCQPFSFAGRRAGTDDPRHLWPHFASALRGLRPRWTLLENVPGHLSLGFDEVLSDLAALGFDAEWELLPASALGAPHLRYRLFVVAHARCGGGESERAAGQVAGAARPGAGEAPERQRVRDAAGGRRTAVADTHGRGLQERPQLDRGEDQDAADGHSRRRHAGGRCDEVADAERSRRSGSLDAEPIGGGAPLLRQGDSVFGGCGQPERRSWWDVEPDVGRVAHGVPSRVDRLRTLGNSVVPQAAEWVGRRILATAGADLTNIEGGPNGLQRETCDG